MNDIDAETEDRTTASLGLPTSHPVDSGAGPAAAIEARQVVDTAVGIVMGKHDCARDIAMSNLHRVARTFDITVLELAQGLVAAADTTGTIASSDPLTNTDSKSLYPTHRSRHS